MKETWNNIWKDNGKYKNSKFRKLSDQKVDRITRNYSEFETAKILEVGCGDGIVLESFSKRFSNSVVTGVDISENAILSANKMNITNSSFSVCDARNLNVGTEIFDLVFSIGLVEHFSTEGLNRCIQEQHRVLKKNGRIVIMVPNKLSVARLQRILLILTGRWKFGFQTEYTPSQIRTLLESHGFGNIKIDTYNVHKPEKIDSFYFIWLIDSIINIFKKDNFFHLYVYGEKNE